MNVVPFVKVIAVLAVLLALVFLWRHEQRSPEQKPLTKISCQPTKENCVAKTEAGQLQWSVEKSIQYLKPFLNKIQLSNAQQNDVHQISIEFVMQGMQMAANRSVLKKQSSGIWQAQSVLPMCVSGRKDWLAIVSVETDQGIWQTGFQFSLPVN